MPFSERWKHPKDYYNQRKNALDLERESFISHYKELSEFIKPRRGRFFITDRNKGTKRYSSIINSKATQAHKIATSGMLAGTMSPTRPWFSLETHDPDMMEFRGVRDYLYKVEGILRAIYNESNFYGMAANFLSELILFGTSAMTHVDDFDDVARFYTHTAGSYMIGTNDRYEVDTFVREYEWPVINIIEKFGLNNVSLNVKNCYDRGDYDKWFPICHFIEPNDEYRPSSSLSRNKAFKSLYYEPSNNHSDRDKWLSVKGFDEFPAYIARWDVTAEDIYGTDCPAMTALGDIKGLQIEEKRKAQAIDKMVNPPLSGPPSLQNVPVSSLPGGLNIYDANERQVLQPIYQVTPQLQEMRLDISAVEQRIDKAFFVDMFLAITTMEGIQPRNQLDLMQRNEERLLQLGPVLERLQGEFLDKLTERTFNQAVRADILPPPPPELAGSPLRVKYISTLAMAQRAVATQGIDRLSAYAGNLIQLGFTGVVDKFNSDQAVDEYATAIGTPPSLVVPDDEVKKIREQRAQQQQAMQAAEMAQSMANTAKMASDAKTDDQSVLTDMMES